MPLIMASLFVFQSFQVMFWENKFGALSSDGEADVKRAPNRSENQVCKEEMSREVSYYSSSFIEV